METAKKSTEECQIAGQTTQNQLEQAEQDLPTSRSETGFRPRTLIENLKFFRETRFLRVSETEDFRQVLWKKLRGGLLVAIGYLLSPLCWWNDIIFNLPIAYFFGYICSWFSPDLLVPCSFAGYWISNIVGILLMQVGAVDILQGKPQERNLKKDLLMGIASSTAYTIAVLALIQLRIIDIPALFSPESSLNIGSLLPMVLIKNFPW